VAGSPIGYGPAQFHAAYGVPWSGSRVTVAVVGAYDDPTVKADLDTYNATFGLPAFPTCTSAAASGCFRTVDQTGGTHYPAVNLGWTLETAMDVETVHQTCPSCKLILVEANSSSLNDLSAAEDRAAALGATVVSNSWGASETSADVSVISRFN